MSTRFFNSDDMKKNVIWRLETQGKLLQRAQIGKELLQYKKGSLLLAVLFRKM